MAEMGVSYGGNRPLSWQELGAVCIFWKELAPNRVEPRVTTSLCNDTWRRFFNVENNI